MCFLLCLVVVAVSVSPPWTGARGRVRDEKPLRITRIPLLALRVSSHLPLRTKADLPRHNLAPIPHKAPAILVGAALCCLGQCELLSPGACCADLGREPGRFANSWGPQARCHIGGHHAVCSLHLAARFALRSVVASLWGEDQPTPAPSLRIP